MTQQGLIAQLQAYFGVRDWAEERFQLEHYRQVGDNAFVRGEYTEALYAFQQMKHRLLEYLTAIRKISRYARFSGWAVALLTGGFGLEDAVIVPMVNKVVLSVLGIDSHTYLEKLKYALRQSCRTLAFVEMPVDTQINLDDVMWWVYNHSDALRDFLLLYELTGQSQITRLLELVDPLGLTGDENVAARVSDAALTDRLLQAIEREGQAIHEINTSFFAYLHRQGMTNTPFYHHLRMKGYTL